MRSPVWSVVKAWGLNVWQPAFTLTIILNVTRTCSDVHPEAQNRPTFPHRSKFPQQRWHVSEMRCLLFDTDGEEADRKQSHTVLTVYLETVGWLNPAVLGEICVCVCVCHHMYDWDFFVFFMLHCISITFLQGLVVSVCNVSDFK